MTSPVHTPVRVPALAPPRTRVLMTGPTPPPRNGMSVTTANLVAGISRHGVDLRLVDTADRRGLRNVGRLDIGNVVAALTHGLRFVVMLVHVRPDVVYVPIAQNRLGFMRDALFLLPARLSSAAVVVHLHGCAFRDFYRSADFLTRWIIRVALAKVACAIVLGPSAVSQFDGLIAEARVRVIPNGVPDLEPQSPDTRLEQVGRGEATVVYLGALTMGKGFADILRAIPLLSDMPGLRFVFAGEFATAESEVEAERLAAGLDLGDRLNFVGPVAEAEAQRLLRTSAALVLPARHVEGQPLVILEAFRAGTPVIATPKGCIVDTVRHGVEGLLVPPGDPAAIARALRQLLSHADAWREVSEAARASFERRFRLVTWLTGLAGVFRDASIEPKG